VLGKGVDAKTGVVGGGGGVQEEEGRELTIGLLMKVFLELPLSNLAYSRH
jgi:hypothetical protein